MKQRALPFGPGAPTKFTYKTGEDILSICKLGICPKEYERMKDDVGIQKIGTSFSDFLDNLPSI